MELFREQEEEVVEKAAAGLMERRSAVVARWSHRVGKRADVIVVEE
jgi:hypothetical protein